MKNILLIGEWYSDNLGDGIIGNTVYNFFQSECSGTIHFFYCDLSFRDNFVSETKIIKKTSFVHEEYIYLRKRIKAALSLSSLRPNNGLDYDFKTKIARILKDNCIKHIVFGGGQMFLQYFKGKIITIIGLAEEMNIQVYFNACGVANNPTKEEQDFISLVESSNVVRFISLRDGENYFSKNSAVISTFDSAILAHNYYKSSKKTEVVGVGVMISRLQPPKKQIDFWDGLINELKNSGSNFQLFCNGAPDDYAFMLFLKERHSLVDEQLAQKPKKPDELISLISSYRIIISLRLHSLITAYSFRVPCIGIAWDDKVRCFFKKIDREQFCFSFTNGYDDIVNAMNRILSDKDFFYKYSYLEDIASENMRRIIKMIKC